MSVFLCAVALAAAACGSDDESDGGGSGGGSAATGVERVLALQGNAANGAMIYDEQGCKLCHGTDGKGAMGLAADFTERLPMISDQEAVNAIYHGVPGTTMIAWSVEKGGPLSEQEIADVYAHVKTFEQ
jgi:mono/diheme cytochrome c family protein